MKQWKLSPWQFAAFSNILLKTFVLNLVVLTLSSVQILGKTQTEYFRFSDFWSSFINENCYNSRTSHDIEMKLGPVGKFGKRNSGTLKKVTMTSCRQYFSYNNTSSQNINTTWDARCTNCNSVSDWREIKSQTLL